MTKDKGRFEAWYDRKSASEKYSDRVVAQFAFYSIIALFIAALAGATGAAGIGLSIALMAIHEWFSLPGLILTIVIIGVSAMALITARKK